MERIGSSRRYRIFDPDHRPYGQHRVGAESERDGGEEPGDAEVEPVDGDEGAGRAGGEAQRIGRHREGDAAESLRGEEQRHPETVEAVNRTEDAQIRRTDTDDLVVLAEESHPGLRIERDDQSDRRTAG